MIVPMKKVFVVALEKDTDSVLGALRRAGTMHVEHHKKPAGTKVDELREKVGRMEKVIEVLYVQEDHHESAPLDDGQEEFEQIWKWICQISELEEDVVQRQYHINKWEPWGSFDISDIERLREKGVFVQLIEVPAAELKKEHKNIILEPVFTQGKVARCLAITREETGLPFKTLQFPKQSLDEMKSAQQKDNEKIKEFKNNIKDAAKFLKRLNTELMKVREELMLQEVSAGRGEHENLVSVKGFCPSEKCGDLENLAKKEKWGLLIEEPSEDDQIPTLLRNPKWVNVIKPVFSIINVLPGYGEVDVSAVFLLFFSVFFGILIGDAGYGLIFSLATGITHFKLGKKIKDKTPFFLMYVLSICTIIWGALTGTFFGQQWIPEGFLGPLVPWLNDTANVQMLCFFIGALHLSIAHVWRAIIKMPSFSVLSEVGWLSLLWGMFFLARVLVLGQSFPGFAKIFFIAGPFLVVFFTKPNINPFKAAGAGIGDLLLNLVNTFTDVVSYIRLFAVGLATVAVADAFNTMALSLGFNNIISGFFAALILVLGHLFNIVLGAMAILVHGLRLNVLEFSSHLKLQWAGIKYNPFKKINENIT